MNTPTGIQHKYYTDSAEEYDSMHVSEGDEHYVALQYAAAIMGMLNADSVLDVGSGTGRSVRYFLDRDIPIVHGIEPVQALINQAVNKHNIPDALFTCGNGENLPFDSDSYDVLCEFGVLHHVPHPERVVKEMMRVARKAIFLSDANRFGQGAWPWRVAKLILYKAHLWPLVVYIKTRGKGYTISQGDGLFYSYSVYDSYDLLAQWGDRVFVIPTKRSHNKTWFSPLLSEPHVLLCAIRDNQ
jgi:ubiquinone/menaquinone biosynthesis C-methylase UbiE